MSMTAEGDSQKALSFSPNSPQERVRRSRVTLEKARPAADAADPGSGARLTRVMAQARRHWALLVLLAAGLGLRVVTQLAYRPALLYIDSPKYLTAGLEKYDPQGYRGLVVRPVEWVGNLALVAAFQHLLGLAMAVALYLLLLRRGVPRWAAALAAAPILLDAYQLQMEQTIMPDVTFEALIVTGLLILLWRPRPRAHTVALAGFVFGTAATVRQVGEALILPAVIAALLGARGWRPRLTTAGLATASFAIPVLLYMTYSAVVLHDRFELSDQGDAVLYGRVAAAADCATLRLPAAERGLCPTPRIVASYGVDGLVNDPYSPAYTVPHPADVSRAEIVKRFSYAVLGQQPLQVAGAIADDAVKLFALTRDTAPGDTPISRWQFQTTYPRYSDTITVSTASALFSSNGGGGAPTAVRPLAVFLRDYQLHGGYTPGPFLLLSLLLGLAGTALGRRRGNLPAVPACLLVTVTGVAVLLGADMYEFSWRYQLPALVTLPAAGALGVTVIQAQVRQARGRKRSAASAPDLAVTLGRCPASPSSPTCDPLTPALSTRTTGSGSGRTRSSGGTAPAVRTPWWKSPTSH